MTITTYPADAVAGQPVYSGRKLRQTNISPFVALGSTARPLGARSGIRPGTPDSVFSISGTTWSVGQHTGIIDTATASESGAYAYANDAAETGTITAASASIIRWDGVFAQLTDPAETPGSGTPRVEFVYVAGTAASTMPATPARSFPLMRIVVPVNGTGSATVVPVAPFTAAAGAPIPFRTVADMKAVASIVGKGTRAYVLATDSEFLHNGTKFVGVPKYVVGPSAQVGANWDGESPLIVQPFSIVATPNVNSSIIVNWPGGAFPNGLLSVHASSGDSNAAARIVTPNQDISLTQFKAFVTTASGGLVTTNARVTGLAIGW